MKKGFTFFTAIAFSVSPLLSVPVLAAKPPLEEEAHPHEVALTVVTEDPVLKEQIIKVHEGLKDIHREMSMRRKAIQVETNESRRDSLYADLDGLRKEHDLLERLLHDLVEEAKATEWTTIDEALRRAKSFERYLEHAYQKEENLRERQQ